MSEISNQTCASCQETVSKLFKCAGCRNIRYCCNDCQRTDWPNHKQNCHAMSIGAEILFEYIAYRLEKSTKDYTYSDFKNYLAEQSPSNTTLQEHMEDWLEGPDTETTQRKKLLRRLFVEKGLHWSQDVMPMYTDWATDETGNRFQKMLNFIKWYRMLF